MLVIEKKNEILYTILHHYNKVRKMNDQSVITLTLGDQAENHAGMQKLGELVEPGQGFNLEDLEDIKRNLEAIGIECELVPLELYQDLDAFDCSVPDPEPAYVLIIRDGVNKILETCVSEEGELDDAKLSAKLGQRDVFEEHLSLELDKQAWMKGRVVNKHARWNLCFDDVGQEPDYEAKKGRIVAYDDIPITKKFLSRISSYFGPKSENLKGEGNYYYDKTKCGIGFHGDSERRKVIGIRLGLGESPPLHFQWFRRSEPCGERIVLNLNGGDMYVMSEKAVGQDWMKKTIYTLRHATGSKKFTSA